MGRRKKNQARCKTCRLPVVRCLCHKLPKLANQTKIILVAHHRELARPSSTGVLALECLERSELWVHGLRERIDFDNRITQLQNPTLLFPTDDAEPIEDQFAAELRGCHLLVPDGNWRQASKIARKIATHARVRQIRLDLNVPTQWNVRRETRVGGMATMEAIAHALGLIESYEIKKRLFVFFDAVTHARIEGRGKTANARGIDVAEAYQEPLRQDDGRRREERSLKAGRKTHKQETPLSDEARVLQRNHQGSWIAKPLQILHRDNSLVAVSKPTGLSVHRGWDRSNQSAVSLLSAQLGLRVYPIHRLDRATSGVLLFSIRRDDVSTYQRALSATTSTKEYVALCRGCDPNLRDINHPLSKKDASKEDARTRFQFLGKTGRYGLYLAYPQTGRTHQIRRHLKHASHPIIGDTRYGKGEHNRFFRSEYKFSRLALHCQRISFQKPDNDTNMVICAPLPPDFRRLLQELSLDKINLLQPPSAEDDKLPRKT